MIYFGNLSDFTCISDCLSVLLCMVKNLKKEKTQYPLRISKELIESLKEAAQKEDRSLNNFMVRELAKVVESKKSE